MAHYGHYRISPEEPQEGDEWITLDRLTHGSHTKKLVLVLARPKVGKTRFVAGLLPNLAEQVPEGQCIRVFTFETSVEEWIKVSACTIAGIPNPTSVDEGTTTEVEHGRYIEAIDYVVSLPIRYYGTPMGFAEVAKKVALKKVPTFLWVLDHFGLVTDNGMERDGTGGLRALSRNLAVLCHEVATGYVIGHLNRTVNNSDEPTITSIGMTDSLGKDFDEAFLLWKPWDGQEKPPDEPALNAGEPVLLKVESRHYAGGRLWLWWDKGSGQFRPLPMEVEDIPKPTRGKHK